MVNHLSFSRPSKPPVSHHALKREKQEKAEFGRSGHIEVEHKTQGVVEVKNRSDSLSLAKYRDIILRAVRLTGPFVPIHFTLCRSVGNLKETEELVNYTDTAGNSFTGNVYISRFDPISRTISLRPAFPEIPDPDRIFVVIVVEGKFTQRDIDPQKLLEIDQLYAKEEMQVQVWRSMMILLRSESEASESWKYWSWSDQWSESILSLNKCSLTQGPQHKSRMTDQGETTASSTASKVSQDILNVIQSGQVKAVEASNYSNKLSLLM